MPKSHVIPLAILTVALGIAGCKTAAILAVENKPFPGGSAETRLEGRAEEIERAAARAGWDAQRRGTGEIGVRYVRGQHVAVASVKYTLDSYSIRLERSENLGETGGTIHKAYNAWVLALSHEIANPPASYDPEFDRVAVSSPPPPTTARTTAAPPPEQVARQPSIGDSAPAPAQVARRPTGGSPPLGFGDQWAVVVGISEYEHTGPGAFGNLEFADNDAEDFYQQLLQLGWEQDHVRVLVNQEATKRNIEYSLETWLRRAAPSDLVVVFWAAHGWPDLQDPEKAYFAAHDSKPSDPSSGLRMDRVRQAIQERQSKNVVFVADTCHSGKVIRSGDARARSVIPALEDMRRRESIPKGWVFITSADSDRKAYEDKAWNNGALTHALLQGLGGEADGYESMGPRNGVVSLAELRAFTMDRMNEESINVLGARLQPLFYTTSGDPRIWDIDLRGRGSVD